MCPGRFFLRNRLVAGLASMWLSGSADLLQGSNPCILATGESSESQPFFAGVTLRVHSYTQKV